MSETTVKIDTGDGPVDVTHALKQRSGRADDDAIKQRSGRAEVKPRDTRKRAVRVRAGTLHAAVKDVAGLVPGRTEIPILSHVEFQVRDGSILVTATDLDCWVSRSLASNDRDGPSGDDWAATVRGFAVAMPGKALEKILKGFDPDAMVTLALETDDGAPDDLTETYTGQVTITSGRARFRIDCLPAADFPAVPPIGEAVDFAMACSALDDAFARVAHAVSTEETRYYLNGVFWHLWQEQGAASELRMVATDGSRLARLSLDVPEGAMRLPDTIVPRRTVTLLEKLLGQAVKTGENSDHVPEVEIERGLNSDLLRYAMPAADGGEVVVVSKCVDGTFPEYARIFSGIVAVDDPAKVTLPRAALLSAIQRIAALTDSKSRAVRFAAADDVATVSVVVAGLGGGSEDLTVVYEGRPIAVGFNSEFWRQALTAIASDDVRMTFGDDAAGPVLVEAVTSDDGTRLLQVLMPMKV
ncbi:DNA polymerase III subunit beta [Croceicoccus naphthovorans]|uniref:Beta sliding clamp n=1 Tax=Croceicoccus naphthovorans TaxID=1348774 RepID=A0A0G3XGU5_9SPHN|nr:DNA polymerase III subunit beta [Croceicoccus naphthovorans]AKM09861.1 hypothetical protein AB433_07480 [Croceicoccus naphthovorans]MBB3991313.1 DNA polymerase-3 subunit beta [Croceicoccus naphthovorans]